MGDATTIQTPVRQNIPANPEARIALDAVRAGLAALNRDASGRPSGADPEAIAAMARDIRQLATVLRRR